MSDLVSVIIPSYNHKKYIIELLRSIRLQSYQNIEIIVVDDGSIDGSVELLTALQNDYQFKLIVKNNEGLCATINRGLDEVCGEYVVIIASDDFMPSKRIEEQVSKLSGSQFDAISGGMTIVSEDSQVLKYLAPLKVGEVFFEDMLKRNLIFAPTVMFKAETFTKFGKYNIQYVVEDYSLWLKILSKNGRIGIYDYNWAYYRKNPELTRTKMEWYFAGLIQVLSDYNSNPSVTKAIKNSAFKYYIKVALFDGYEVLKNIKLKTESKFLPALNGMQLAVIYMVMMMPSYLKRVLQKYL